MPPIWLTALKLVRACMTSVLHPTFIPRSPSLLHSSAIPMQIASSLPASSCAAIHASGSAPRPRLPAHELPSPQVLIRIFSQNFLVESLLRCSLVCSKWGRLTKHATCLLFDCIDARYSSFDSCPSLRSSDSHAITPLESATQCGEAPLA